jgi:intracellular sulfur oxidation DsrE/DsrF family protein
MLWLAVLALLALVFTQMSPADPVATAKAQAHPYQVVFDLTSRDSLDQKAVMRWIREISESSPEAKMEVVMYGKGFELVMPEKSTQMDAVRKALMNRNVTFKVCEIALKNNQVDKSQVVDGVGTVPDGIHEIVTKQQHGWGYIKVMH